MYMDEQGRSWFKGNLHTHTTLSDGRRTPEEVISLYKENGYDFLALTDHWRLSETKEAEGLLLLSGCEYDVGSAVQSGIFHIVAIGMEEAPAFDRSASLTAQDIINAINNKNGLAFLAHPAWSMNRPSDLEKLTGLAGVEIYNTVSGRPWNCRPYSGAEIDAAAAAGTLLPCTAADDAHFYNGDQACSYIMVQADELTPAALLDAIRRGDFYATQGPRFSVSVSRESVHVNCSPVRDVVFFSDAVYVSDRVTRGEAVREASHKIMPNETFVRVELTDADGRCAWSSPISLNREHP